MITQVTAVVGACGPERRRYARDLAKRRRADLVSAQRIADHRSVIEHALESSGDRPLVVEGPLQLPALELIGTIADSYAPVELTDVICLVDAMHLLSDVTSAERLRLQDHPSLEGTELFASRAELVVTQIEYASTVVLVNIESLNAHQLNRLLALISHLSPKAQLELAEHSGYSRPSKPLRRFTTEQTQAGWISLLNRDFSPQFKDDAITALRYEQMRPFHPGRLRNVIDRFTPPSQDGMLLRSAGFCHLATRAHITGLWNQFSTQFQLTPINDDHQIAAEDEMLAFGQDLALFSLGIDPDVLLSELDHAVLTDVELEGGPALWSTFRDPFPEWSTADR